MATISDNKKIKFQCKKTFTCAETGSVYIKGYFYKIDPKNTKLKKRVNKWVTEKSVVIAKPGQGNNNVKVKGKGKVTPPKKGVK